MSSPATWWLEEHEEEKAPCLQFSNGTWVAVIFGSRLFGFSWPRDTSSYTFASKQILPASCPWKWSRRRVRTLTQSAQSICHSLKIESSLQSVQFLPPALGGGDGEEGQPLSKGTFQEEWLLLIQLMERARLPVVPPAPQPPLKCFVTQQP